jgi:V/A-type H+-transporting ATPase subunit E
MEKEGGSMDLEQQKLEQFRRLVLSDAEQKRDEILEELDRKAKEKLEERRRELSALYSKKSRQEKERMQRQTNERIAQFQTQQKRELLKAREAVVEQVFDQVKEKLAAYVQTAEYGERCLNEIQALKNVQPGRVIATVFKEDTILRKALEAAGYQVETTEDCYLGGCTLLIPEGNMQIDLTFRSKLERARESFLETYQLEL